MLLAGLGDASCTALRSKQVFFRDWRDGPAQGWPLFNMAGRANLADILLKIT